MRITSSAVLTKKFWKYQSRASRNFGSRRRSYNFNIRFTCSCVAFPMFSPMCFRFLRPCKTVSTGSLIPIVMPDPRHPVRQSFFIPALWCQVQEVIGPNQNIQSSCIRRVGVENFTTGILVEHAGARTLFPPELPLHFEVIERVALLQLFLGERNMIVEIEIAPRR